MSVIVAGSTTLDEVDDAGRLVVVGTVVVVGSTVVVGARLVDTAVAEPVTGSPAVRPSPTTSLPWAKLAPPTNSATMSRESSPRRHIIGSSAPGAGPERRRGGGVLKRHTSGPGSRISQWDGLHRPGARARSRVRDTIRPCAS